jgi:HK97 family phage major capsid protein
MDNTVRKFAIVAKADECEILLYDQIGMSMWGDGITAKQVKAAMDGAGKVSRIVLRVNSPGGDVFEGSAIYDLIKQSETPVDVVVDGICASAAFTIMCAARRVEVGEAAMLMLHNSRGGAFGEADDMRHTAEILDKINVQMAEIYAKRCGKSVEDVRAMMDAETWLTPAEAVEHGFADAICEPPEREEDMAAKMVAALDINKFRNAPESLKLRVAALATSTSQAPAPKKAESTPAKADHQETKAMSEQIAASAVEVKENYGEVCAQIEKIGTEHGIDRDVLRNLMSKQATLAEAKEVISDFTLARARTQKNTAGLAQPTVENLTDNQRKDYSIARALMHLADPQNTEAGLEREVSQDLARRLKVTPRGILIPTRLNPHMSGLDTKTNGAGKYTTAVVVGELIDLLRNRMKVAQLGATMLSGLSSNVTFPVQLTGSAGAWVAENPGSNVAESDATFGLKTLSPKTYQATTSFSRQLLSQSSIDVESFVRNDLATAHALAIDAAAINGPGTGNAPLGLLRTTGIGDVAIGANGGAPTFPKIVDVETAVADANADEAGMAWLTTPVMRGKLKQSVVLASTDSRMIWQQNGNAPGIGDLIGYPAHVSKQVPSTLVKGGSGAVCHAIILGYWPSLIIGEWGVIDLIVDPYALKKQGMVEVTSFQMVDVLLRRPAQFAAIQDATA